MSHSLLTDPWIWGCLGLALAGVGGLLLGNALGRRDRQLADRLAPHVAPVGDLGPSDRLSAAASLLKESSGLLPPRWEALLSPLIDFGLTLAGTDYDRKKMRRLLALAGFRSATDVGLLMLLKGACGLFCVALMLGVVVAPADRLGLTGLAGGLIALFVGTAAPEAWLKLRAASRGERLGRSVPDALDLMVICAESGLPIGRVLQVVAKEMSLSSPEMADELRYTAAELQILSDRSQALLNLGERTQVPEIETMVATLIQADRYGTPLSHALRTIADESRKSLILSLEEKAGKLPAQLSVPLMVLILPPIVALMGAPALVRVVRMLGTN